MKLIININLNINIPNFHFHSLCFLITAKLSYYSDKRKKNLNLSFLLFISKKSKIIYFSFFDLFSDDSELEVILSTNKPKCI